MVEDDDSSDDDEEDEGVLQRDGTLQVNDPVPQPLRELQRKGQYYLLFKTFVSAFNERSLLQVPEGRYRQRQMMTAIP